MILWIDGTFGVGKTAVAIEVCKILGKDRCIFYDPDLDFKDFCENGSIIMFGGGTMAQNNNAFLKQTRAKIIEFNKSASKDNKIVIIPMAMTENECKELLLDYLLSENIDIKHFILVSSAETIKRRIMNNENRDKSFSLTFLKTNITFLDENYKYAIRIDTNQKTPEEVANEICKILLVKSNK